MTWRIINELTSRKIHGSSVKEIKLDNSSISDPLSSAFNDHISSIGLKLTNAILQNRDTPSYLDYREFKKLLRETPKTTSIKK